MTKHQERQEAEDRELTRLFASMDEITASDALKDKTLAAIFDQLDEEDQSPAEESPAHAHLTLVQDAPAATKAPKRARGWRLKVAASIVAVALAVGGSVAYALPTNHVQVTVDQTTFDLGVNVFGTTVTAAASDDDGKAIIETSDVHNRVFRDALDRILDAYEKRHNTTTERVAVHVDERFGSGGDKLNEEAAGAVRQREERHASEQTQQPEPAQPESAPAPAETPQPAEPAEPAPSESAPSQRREEPQDAPQADDAFHGELGGGEPGEPMDGRGEPQQELVGELGPQEQGGMSQTMGGEPPQ